MSDDIAPQAFWQTIEDAGTYEEDPPGGFRGFFPARLPDGRQLALPIRERGNGEALASLIINQASFTVLDALAEALATMARNYAPDIVVAMPTLGLALAEETARRLGHDRYVPLSTSHKFWYDEALSIPLRSITSPDQEKRLFMDPRMLPLLENRSIILIDDALSTGTSILAGCRLLEKCAGKPSLIGCAMLQTDRWRAALRDYDRALAEKVLGVFKSPRLAQTEEGGWLPQT